MSHQLLARFEKQFSSGVPIQGELAIVAKGFSITVLLGPSGCGKTTVLRCLAGLERPEAGRIEFNSEIWFDAEQKIQRSPQDRGIGFLFQDYALFPHLTVAQNIGYGLTKCGGDVSRSRVAVTMHQFQLDRLADRFPGQLSGGQQQRVALARVLALRPRLLLLDEPLSALDEELRDKLRHQMRGMLAEFGIPVVLVTHDRREAQALADQVVEFRPSDPGEFGPCQRWETVS